MRILKEKKIIETWIGHTQARIAWIGHTQARTAGNHKKWTFFKFHNGRGTDFMKEAKLERRYPQRHRKMPYWRRRDWMDVIDMLCAKNLAMKTKLEMCRNAQANSISS